MNDKEMQDVDYQWFLDNTEELYKEHGEKFVAIKNKSILGIYNDYDSGIEETMKQEELGSFLVQKLLENKDAAQIISGTGYFLSDWNNVWVK